jgi:hypothetical protein
LQIDYVLSYPQAVIERDMYMSIPKGYQIQNPEPGIDYVLHLHHNIYGQKQAGRVWNHHLVSKLKKVGFVQCQANPCVFLKGSSIYILYTDDSILACPDAKELDIIINSIWQISLDITMDSTIQDFLGVRIEKCTDRRMHLTQPHLINSIIHDLHLQDPKVNAKDTPGILKILQPHHNSSDFDGHFHYWRVIGKLNYLEKSTRPDIAYQVHQCARFCVDPKIEHGQAVKRIGCYLKGNQDKLLIYQPDTTKGLEVFVNADFAGNWNQEFAEGNCNIAQSRHGYAILYARCPVVWASQLQSEIALSTTEAEYIGISYALRTAIHIMNLLKEMKTHGIAILSTQAQVHCKVFETTQGQLN